MKYKAHIIIMFMGFLFCIIFLIMLNNKRMEVKFYPNIKDGTYCWQAAIQMVLNTFSKTKQYTIEEVIKISGKKEGQWTWPTQTLLWLNKNNYETMLIEDFDYHEFAQNGLKYLESRYGNEVANAQSKMSDIHEQQELAKKFIPIINIQKRPADKKDIIDLLEKGYLIITNINAAKLFNLNGYSAHFVLIFKADDKSIHLHDPGLPPKPNLKVSWEQFEKAWGYPSSRDKNLLAIKSKEKSL